MHNVMLALPYSSTHLQWIFRKSLVGNNVFKDSGIFVKIKSNYSLMRQQHFYSGTLNQVAILEEINA